MSALRLVLDEHISPRVADALRRRSIDTQPLAQWRAGALLGRPDAEILAAAAAERRALVTYDVRTIPPLLRRMAETGVAHAGVILVSARGYPFGETRRLVRALGELADTREDRRNQVLFLSA